MRSDILLVGLGGQGILTIGELLASAAQRKGIAVLVHTINDPKAMREFLDAGMDCILTDNPSRLAELIAQVKR